MEGNAENGGEQLARRLRIVVWGLAALILVLPLVAMQFSDEVNWGVFDFALAAALVIGAGAGYELIVRVTDDNVYRAAAGVALGTAFVLVWISAGVGIIGRDGDPANLIYAGVLAVAFTGSVVARPRPDGMARALQATAVAQALAAAIALVAGWGTATARWPLDILGLTVIFGAMWLLSAWLFQKAARGEADISSAGGGGKSTPLRL